MTPPMDGLEVDGYAFVDLADPPAAADQARSAPFEFVRRLLGATPTFVEQQPIRPVDQGRSFASSRGLAPLHTDSQMVLGIPAVVQILVCVRAAPHGGESVLVDGQHLFARLDREQPALAAAIVGESRTQRFYFGEVSGPTLALRGGHLAWTVAPMATDPIGRALETELEREPRVVRTLRSGEVLVARNDRMLHGRMPFEGDRELVRLLVWLDRPFSADPRVVARARLAAPPIAGDVRDRVAAVLAVMRGVAPARVAREAGVDEATLYAWRDRFVAGGMRAL